MKKTNLFIALLIIVGGCNKEIVSTKPFCKVTDPIEELPWLKTIIEEQMNNKYSKMTIYKYEYNEQEGFLVDSCIDCLDNLAIFYNCSGKNVCEFGGKNMSNTCPDFSTKSIEKEIIFIDTLVEKKPDTYFCNLDNPLEDLDWLKNIIVIQGGEFAGKTEIYQCIYDEKQAFLIYWCLNCPDGLTELFSCDSTVLCEFGGIDGHITCPDFEEKATDLKLIWLNY